MSTKRTKPTVAPVPTTRQSTEALGSGIGSEQVTGPLGPPPLPTRGQRSRGTKNLSAPVAWLPTPAKAGQVFEPDTWRVDRVETKVFDLSKPEDVQQLNTLMTELQNPDSGKLPVHRDRQFSDKTGNWMVLIEYQHLLFKQIFAKEESDEKAS